MITPDSFQKLYFFGVNSYHHAKAWDFSWHNYIKNVKKVD